MANEFRQGIPILFQVAQEPVPNHAPWLRNRFASGRIGPVAFMMLVWGEAACRTGSPTSPAFASAKNNPPRHKGLTRSLLLYLWFECPWLASIRNHHA
jgi:hypothetical protein